MPYHLGYVDKKPKMIDVLVGLYKSRKACSARAVVRRLDTMFGKRKRRKFVYGNTYHMQRRID